MISAQEAMEWVVVPSGTILDTASSPNEYATVGFYFLIFVVK